MMQDIYKKAYKEVYEIVKLLPKEDFNKIPLEMIEMLKCKMDVNYDYKLDKSKPFEEQTMLEETREILAIFYKDYWATEEELIRINKKIAKDVHIAEQKKVDNYDYKDIFSSQKVIVSKHCNIEQNNESENQKSGIMGFFKNLFSDTKI